VYQVSIPNLTLEGKTAIVTGGSRGIGKAISLIFAEAGADVVICGRTIADLEAVAQEIRGLGRRCLAVPADITQKAAVDNLVRKTIDEFGVIDILVNNAGTGILLPLLEHSEEDWDRVIDTNLKGYYLCSRAVGRRMIDQKKGNIISISSIRGLEAYPGRGAYCVSKAGVIMMTRVLALELSSYNIRANAIAPGFVRTELTESSWADPKTREQITAQIPMGRWGTLNEIANVALFLASDASSYITGHTIVVSGGWSS